MIFPYNKTEILIPWAGIPDFRPHERDFEVTDRRQGGNVLVQEEIDFLAEEYQGDPIHREQSAGSGKPTRTNLIFIQKDNVPGG